MRDTVIKRPSMDDNNHPQMSLIETLELADFIWEALQIQLSADVKLVTDHFSSNLRC